MKDPIELLEAIGVDASLRHASGEDLAHVLEERRASHHLKQAAASGDRAFLEQELGYRVSQMVQNPTQTGFEEDAEEAPAPTEPDKEAGLAA